MPYEGMPSQPTVVFVSGDICYLVDSSTFKKGGKRMLRMIMIPTEHVMWKYDIPEEKLDKSISSYGTITSEYPEDYLIGRGDDPSNPVIIMGCNFDGTPNLNCDITAMADRLARKENEINNLRTEIDSLYERYLSQSERLRQIGNSDES
jgi:hypothetical protein